MRIEFFQTYCFEIKIFIMLKEKQDSLFSGSTLGIPWPDENNQHTIRKQQSEYAEALRMKISQKYVLSDAPVRKSYAPQVKKAHLIEPPKINNPQPLHLNLDFSSLNSKPTPEFSFLAKNPQPAITSRPRNPVTIPKFQIEETPKINSFNFSFSQPEKPIQSARLIQMSQIDVPNNEPTLNQFSEPNFTNFSNQNIPNYPRSSLLSQNFLAEQQYKKFEFKTPMPFTTNSAALPTLPTESKMIYPDGHESPLKNPY